MCCVINSGVNNYYEKKYCSNYSSARVKTIEELITFFEPLSSNYIYSNIFILFIGDLKNEKKVLQWLIDQKSKNPHPFINL